MVLFGVLAVVLPVAAGAAPRTLPGPTSVPFGVVATGDVSAKFHARRAGNRVFFAASLKQAQPWLRFTGANLAQFDFNAYGLVAILYRKRPDGNAQVRSVLAGNDAKPEFLAVEINFRPHCPPFSPCPYIDPTRRARPVHPIPWGSFILVRVEKASISAPPQLVYVSESAEWP